MTDIPQCFTDMLAAWNEKDPSKVRAHLEKALAKDVVFVDPKYWVEGIDQFEAMVAEFHADYAVSTCEHISGLDHHHNRYRYEWRVSINGVPAMTGMDVVELNTDGKVARIDGFFGPFPKKVKNL